ncbi:MAG: hypothetical protein R6X02_17735 [Enhygromyxa sp.]
MITGASAGITRGGANVALLARKTTDLDARLDDPGRSCRRRG